MFLSIERPVITVYQLLYDLKLSVLPTHGLYVPHDFHNKHLLFSYKKLIRFSFIVDIHCVVCEVGTEFFYVVFVLKGWYNFILLLFYTGARGGAVGRGFGSRWCHWNFSLT